MLLHRPSSKQRQYPKQEVFPWSPLLADVSRGHLSHPACPSMSSSTRQPYTGSPWPGVVKPGVGQAFENSLFHNPRPVHPLILHLLCRFCRHLAYAVNPNSIGSIVQHEHFRRLPVLKKRLKNSRLSIIRSQPRTAMKMANQRLILKVCRRAHCSGVCYPYLPCT